MNGQDQQPAKHPPAAPAHCGHWHVCYKYRENFYQDKGKPCICKKCMDDTRTRQQPAPETCRKYWNYRANSGHLYHLVYDLLDEIPTEDNLGEMLCKIRDGWKQPPATDALNDFDNLKKFIQERKFWCKNSPVEVVSVEPLIQEIRNIEAAIRSRQQERKP